MYSSDYKDMKIILCLVAASAALALPAAARLASTRKDTLAGRTLILSGLEVARGSGGTVRGCHHWQSCAVGHFLYSYVLL